MTKRSSLAAVGVVALALAAAGAATNAGPEERTESQPPAATAVPVQTAVATPVASHQRTRVYTGTLVARRRSVLSFERGGKLAEIGVDEGGRVEQHHPLAQLDTRRLQAKRARAEADLKQASAVLDELVAGPRTQTIAASRAEVKNLSAQRDLAELRFHRREKLVGTNAVSREEYDESLYTYHAASARTEVAQKSLDELEAGTREERLAAQRAQVASLEAALADIHHEMDDAVLLAPYSGRITQRRVDEGTVVRAGDPVLELIEDDALEAWVGVPPHAAGALVVGETTRLTIDGRPYRATVQSLRPELDPETRTQNVVLRLDAPRGLVAGQVVRVGVSQRVDEAGFWVPTAALTPDRRGLWSLLVVDEESLAAARPVEVLENEADRSFVRGALQPGERVIVGGAHRVVAGQSVRPQPADASGDAAPEGLSKK